MKNNLLLILIGFLMAFTGLARAEEQNTFTINANGDQVIFAPGNLQYQASTSTWRFAEHQYDYAGAANANMSATCSDWVDLFGWGTSGYHDENDANNTQYQPWSVSTAIVNASTNYYGYGPSTDMLISHLMGSSVLYDWGQNCTISNGGSYEWFTLTGGRDGEWHYLLNERATTSGMRYATATVNEINGLVLFPDGWESSLYTIVDYNSFNAPYSSNVISETDWTETLEANGCVFLPAAGYRNGVEVDSVGTTGFYWSSIAFDMQHATGLWFTNISVFPGTGGGFRYYGGSVRLVYKASESQSTDINVSLESLDILSMENVECGVNITSDGGEPIIKSGLCWATHTAPTLSDFYTEDGADFGSFTSTISYHFGAKTHHVRAYAMNRFGVTYSTEELDFNLFPEGIISGKFSINATGQEFYFSQGNLQYIGSAATPYWQFAENQWDALGDQGQGSDAQNVDRDLFGWGTSGYNHGAVQYQPWSTSPTSNHYCAYGEETNNLYDKSGKAEWGYNAISNGGNQENQWRTLTKDEWDYLFNTRNTTSNIRYTKAQVNGVKGVILLPDDWSSSIYTLKETNTSAAEFSKNVIDATTWQNVLEPYGAVFLPITGRRDGNSVWYATSYGYYWSSSYYVDNYTAYDMYFDNSSVNVNANRYRCTGLSVRLIRPVNQTLTAGELTLSDVTDHSVDFSVTIADESGLDVNACGLCWSTNPNPDLSSDTIVVPVGNGTLSGTLKGLKSGIKYYVRAYAINNKTGWAVYGEPTEFITLPPEGALPYKFTVSYNGDAVFFSQGNLQYIGSAETPYWQFAGNQWDALGDNGQCSEAQNVDRDLFGWGTSGWDNGNTYYHPYDTDESAGNQYGPLGNSDLTGTYANADWGVYNAILNGGNASGQWRTLTADEWSYLFFTRSTTSGKRFARAQLNGVNGVILLPDDWNSSCYTLNTGNSYTSNVVDASTWQSVFEANGAVFLPLAGYRSGTSVVDDIGYYWTSTSSLTSSSPNAKNWQIQNSTIYGGNVSRVKGNSVRLVRPVTQTLTVGKLTLSDIADHSVDYSVTITDEEGLDVKACGLCWSTKPNPDLRSDTIVVPVGNGTLTGTLKGLISGTKYYVRAYATNKKTGLTVYGEVKEITTTGIQGTLAGKFAVSATDTVCFSQGNLQYIGSATTPYWQFAENQWDYLGNNGQGSDAQNVDRDLFGWGTSGYDHGANQYQPWATSTASSDYYAYGSDAKDLYNESGKADWGYNAISNGGNQENQWRTLTKDEWYYLFMTRETTSTIRYALAQVCGVNGLILLPDDWESSIYTLNYTNNSEVAYTSNVVNSTTWHSVFEANGAVFLPAAGDRNGSSVIIVGSYGYYWSSSYCNSSSAYYLDFNGSYLDTYYSSRYYGQSVRLVRSL